MKSLVSLRLMAALLLSTPLVISCSKPAPPDTDTATELATAPVPAGTTTSYFANTETSNGR